jgi:hypothetical protein
MDISILLFYIPDGFEIPQLSDSNDPISNPIGSVRDRKRQNFLLILETTKFINPVYKSPENGSEMNPTFLIFIPETKLLDCC